jgi:hypothetical protein
MEARQLFLFDAAQAPTRTLDPTPTPCDPHAEPQDRPRLTGQNATILHLLRMGPCTNVELNRVSMKHTSRISDLRAAGYKVICHRGKGGLNVYELKE